MEDDNNKKVFQGFSYPDDDGFTRLPNNWFDVCAKIDNLAELKVMLYLARHTWGFQEYDKWKRISVDEFMQGRKRRDGSRMDSGTGLSEMSVRHGLDKAIEHGYVVWGINRNDLARIEKYYYLKMRQSESEV